MLALKETWEWRKDKALVDIFKKIEEGQTLQKNQFKFVLKSEVWFLKKTSNVWFDY